MTAGQLKEMIILQFFFFIRMNIISNKNLKGLFSTSKIVPQQNPMQYLCANGNFLVRHACDHQHLAVKQEGLTFEFLPVRLQTH